MLYSYRIEQAIRAAAVLHQGQVRKGGAPYPYITHPYAVACIIADYTEDEDTIIAGLLHDTLEDTDYSPEELEADFGPQVLRIVLGVTEDTEGSWAARKASYLRALKDAPAASFMVAAADKIHNLRSVIEEYHEDPLGYLENFGGSLEERFDHYQRLAALFNVKLGNDIIREFNHVFSEYKRFIDHAKEAHEKND
jgi:hypothetical protein